MPLEGGRILTTIHGIQFQGKVGQTGTFFFRISLLNEHLEVHRNLRQKTKNQKLNDTTQMVKWNDDTPCHFSFKDDEIIGIRVTLMFTRNKVEKTVVASIDIPTSNLQDDQQLRRKWRLVPKQEGTNLRFPSTSRVYKVVCIVDMSIKYETDRTSTQKGEMVSYVNLNQTMDQAKSRKKLEKKGEEFALQTDEVVVGSFRCIWGRMRGDLYLSTRRLMFVSDGLVSRGKRLQIFWSQVVDIAKKKKPSRGVLVQATDRLFHFEGFLKPNKVFVILCTLRSKYEAKKNEGKEAELNFDEYYFDDVLEEEAKEMELEGEYCDEILEDLADEAATMSYLAPVEPESLKDGLKQSYVDKLQLEKGDDWKALVDTIGVILEEEAEKRKKEEEVKQKELMRTSSSALKFHNLPAEEELISHFGRLPFQEGDEAVFELINSEKRVDKEEKKEEEEEGGLWATTKLHFVSFFNVFPVVILLNIFHDSFEVARIMDAVVFSLFLVFTAPVMFFVMRTLTASLATLVLAKARDGVVDKHTDVLSNVILPFVLTPLWYVMLVGGVCVMMEGVNVEGVMNSFFVTIILALSLSSTFTSWTISLKDFIQDGLQKNNRTNDTACWKQLNSRFGENPKEKEKGKEKKKKKEKEKEQEKGKEKKAKKVQIIGDEKKEEERQEKEKEPKGKEKEPKGKEKEES